MARFHTSLVMTPVGAGRLWILDAPLVYESDIAGVGIITVPTGFLFDGNSMPRLAWIVSPPSDYMQAGCCHDFLYRFGGVSRGAADAVYREALELLGMGNTRRNLRYIALRLFGWRAFKAADEKSSPL